MNKTTPEYKRVREEIAKQLFVIGSNLPEYKAIEIWERNNPNHAVIDDWRNAEREYADAILEIKGIAILNDNQKLPEPIFSYPLKEASRAYYDVGQDRMVQANFKRLVE